MTKDTRTLFYFDYGCIFGSIKTESTNALLSIEQVRDNKKKKKKKKKKNLFLLGGGGGGGGGFFFLNC
ncbi:hypothetical protein HanRHA438_Chr01g0020821 [Helianthus annuus]|nr:hypothetical protein HanRHA438_Chr01g0020821 [Helianthus annuus]